MNEPQFQCLEGPDREGAKRVIVDVGEPPSDQVANLPLEECTAEAALVAAVGLIRHARKRQPDLFRTATRRIPFAPDSEKPWRQILADELGAVMWEALRVHPPAELQSFIVETARHIAQETEVTARMAGRRAGYRDAAQLIADLAAVAREPDAQTRAMLLGDMAGMIQGVVGR